MTKHPLFIHPATPPKLVTMFRRAIGKNGKGYNFIALAEQLGVNRRYVHDLITKGIEPANPEIRKKLFLKKPRAEREKKPYIEPPEHIKWWRSLNKDDRSELIKDIHYLRSPKEKTHAHPNPDPSHQ